MRWSTISKEINEAQKHGIDTRDLVKDRNILFACFEKPCFLLIYTWNIQKKRYVSYLYTPFGCIEYKDEYWVYESTRKIKKTPRKAFKQITGVKKIPYGKDTMKKIEALLLQASI